MGLHSTIAANEKLFRTMHGNLYYFLLWLSFMTKLTIYSTGVQVSLPPLHISKGSAGARAAPAATHWLTATVAGNNVIAIISNDLLAFHFYKVHIRRGRERENERK